MNNFGVNHIRVTVGPQDSARIVYDSYQDPYAREQTVGVMSADVLPALGMSLTAGVAKAVPVIGQALGVNDAPTTSVTHPIDGNGPSEPTQNSEANGEAQSGSGKGMNLQRFAEDPAGEVKAEDLQFSAKQTQQKWDNQMNERGWTKQSVADVRNNPYTTREALNRANGNPATAYYTENGAYVVFDDVTGKVVQVGDAKNPSAWTPDESIKDPYQPWK